MSLPRKVIKAMFDHDTHAAIKAIAESEGHDGMGPWIETVVEAIVRKRVHKASLVVSRLNESGSLKTFMDDQEPAQTFIDEDD